MDANKPVDPSIFCVMNYVWSTRRVISRCGVGGGLVQRYRPHARSLASLARILIVLSFLELSLSLPVTLVPSLPLFLSL